MDVAPFSSISFIALAIVSEMSVSSHSGLNLRYPEGDRRATRHVWRVRPPEHDPRAAVPHVPLVHRELPRRAGLRHPEPYDGGRDGRDTLPPLLVRAHHDSRRGRARDSPQRPQVQEAVRGGLRAGRGARWGRGRAPAHLRELRLRPDPLLLRDRRLGAGCSAYC